MTLLFFLGWLKGQSQQPQSPGAAGGGGGIWADSTRQDRTIYQ